MSMPQFPINEPPLTREDSINQIISSIAMEELGLSHIINAEGEKLQYVLGTIEGLTGPGATIDDVLKVNESVRAVLQTAAENQSILRNKLQNALSSAVLTGPTGPPGPRGPVSVKVVRDVDNLEPEEDPYVENDGDDDNLELRFGIPRGMTGATGATGATGGAGTMGPPGPTGLAATIKVGEVFPVAYADTYVRNVGSDNAAVLDFGIPVGPAGPQGPAGVTGVAPHIDGTSGHWFVGDEDTGITAQGEPGPQGEPGAAGKDGESAFQLAVDEGFEGDLDEWLASLKGEPGDTPEIGTNGNWFIGGVDTELPSRGEKGNPGTFDPNQKLFNVSTGKGRESEEVLFEGDLAFESDTLKITVEPGPTVKIENPSAGAGAIIPFASGVFRETINTGGDLSGNRNYIALVGFGSADTYGAPGLPAAPFAAPSNKEFAFQVPVNGTITALSAFITLFSPSGVLWQTTVIAARIYTLNMNDNTYYPLHDKAKIEFVLEGNVLPSTQPVYKQGYTGPISVPVLAGTKLLLVFEVNTPNYRGICSVNGIYSGGLKIEPPQ